MSAGTGTAESARIALSSASVCGCASITASPTVTSASVLMYLCALMILASCAA